MIKFKNYARNLFDLKKWCFLGLVAIPLDNPSDWHLVTFGSIPPNKIKVENKQLSVSVDKSASPIIYSLKKPRQLNGFKLAASVSGNIPKIPPGNRQGVGSFDDFTLRLGFIVKGPQKMSWLQKQMAPDWLLEMQKLLPKSQGIKEVQFFTTCRQEDVLNKKRNHPMNSLLKEECILLLDNPGSFTLVKSFKSPMEVIGLWIGADGDGTGSKFQLDIKSLELNYK